MTGSPTTQSVRTNFTAAKSEIEVLQSSALTNQYKLSNVVSIREPQFGAVCDGVTDDTAAVLAAIAALTSGGTLLYSGTPLLSSEITVDKKIRLVGVGAAGVNAVTRPASYFVKKSTMTSPAISIIADGVIMEGGGVVGQGGNTGDNIVVNANSVSCLFVYSEGAGQDGFRRGTDAGTNNANSCAFFMCRSVANTRRGFYDRDLDSDNNAGTYYSCVAQTNGEDGFRNGIAGSSAQGSNNKYINCVGEGNTGRGINIVGGTANEIDGGDYETNTAGQILIGVDAALTVLSNIQPAFTIVDNSATTVNLSNLVRKQGTWTPVLFGAGTAGVQTYAAQTAMYVRMGDMCFIAGNITLSAKDAAMAGNVRISGLPFLYPSGFSDFVAITMSQWGDITLPANYTQIHGQIRPNEQVIRLTRSGSGQTAAFVDAAEIGATPSNAPQIVFSGWYPIN